MSPKQIIFRLETKVESAIDLIQKLKQRVSQLSSEKDQIQKKFQEYEETIQGQLDEYEERVLELEKLVDSAQKEQSNLEKSVVNAISVFETVEELKNGIDATPVSHTNNPSTIDNNTIDNNTDTTVENINNDTEEELSSNVYDTTQKIDEGDDIFINDSSNNDHLSANDTTDIDNKENIFQNDDNDINIDEIDFSSDFDPDSDNPDSKENEDSKLEIL